MWMEAELGEVLICIVKPVYALFCLVCRGLILALYPSFQVT